MDLLKITDNKIQKKKIFIFEIFSFFLILKLSSGCKIDNETCVCLSIYSKTLLMECLTTRIEQTSFNLDFSSLNLTNNKMTINMTIQNKIFTKVGFSKKHPNQFENIVALNLEKQSNRNI